MSHELRKRVLFDAGLERRPLVLLHGFMGRADDWKGIGADLGHVTGRSVVAVDLPGHGSSIGLPDAAYSFEGTTAALRDTVFEAGLAPAVLIGYSMGGRVAMAAACRTPEMIAALVVESGHPGLDDPAGRISRREQDRQTAERIMEDWPDVLRSWYDQPVFRHASPELVERWIERRRRGDPAELARALTGLSTGRQEPLSGRLSRLNRPLLFIAGGEDRKYVEIGRSLTALSERMTFCVVDDAGHNAHDERPGAYLRALEEFLQPID